MSHSILERMHTLGIDGVDVSGFQAGNEAMASDLFETQKMAVKADRPETQPIVIPMRTTTPASFD